MLRVAVPGLAGYYMLFEESDKNSYDVMAVHSGRVAAVVNMYLHDDLVAFDHGATEASQHALGGSLKDGADTIALGSEVSGTLPVANGGTGYTGGAFTTASGGVLKNQGGTNFGSGSYSYSYIVIGKLCIVSGRATVTTLAPNSGSDQVSIPLPVNSLSNGSFTCRNTANGRIADGRTIATSPVALIYDSVGLTDGAYFDFTMIYETV